MKSVLGIYARETGQGMIFSHYSDSSEQKVEEPDIEASRPRPHLKVVK
jgi:stringent starvation protein B